MATEVLRNEPSISVEWGAKLWKLTMCVNEACDGVAKVFGSNGDPATSRDPQRVRAFSQVEVREEGPREG
eukprot:6207845-Alexandrium_andersonii.AAC.1